MGTIVPYAEFQLRQEVRRFEQHLDDDAFALMYDCALELQVGMDREEVGELHLQVATSIEAWLRVELFRAIRRTRLFEASVVANVGYVAAFLSAYRGKSFSDMTLGEHMMQYAATADPQILLNVAEDAFYMYCCFPEHRVRRTVAYRQLARNVGRYAYAHYAAATQKPFGAEMADAFEPLGVLSRRLLASHVH